MKELRNNKFQKALVQFFVSYWFDNKLASFLQNKIYVNFVDENGSAPQFSCPVHEEADAKIIYHLCQVQKDNNIIIKCSELIIMLKKLVKNLDRNKN